MKCVFWFSLQILSETFLILRRIQRDIVIMYKWINVKYRLFLSKFNQTRNVSTDFRKNIHIKFHENPSSGRRVVQCGRTDMTKLTLNLLTTTIVAPPSNASKWQMGFNSAFKGLIVVFRNFANAPQGW